MFQLKQLKMGINKGTEKKLTFKYTGRENQCGLIYVGQCSIMPSCTVPYRC